MKPATFWQKQSVRLVAAWLLPLVVGLLQWNLARYFGPFPWFLFYQVAFLAPIIGGVFGGVGATLLSALCVWYFFLPPQLTFSLHKPGFPASVLVFIATGIGFTLYHREMRKRQERYRALFQEAGEGIVVVDSQGRFVDANDTFCTLTGRSRAEILAGSVPQFDIAMSPAVRSTADSQLAAAGVASFEGQIRRTDRSLMKVEVTVTPLDAGQRLAIVRSVDERKRMENAMRQSEEKFAKFFHSSPIALAVFDLHDGRLVDVNEAFVKQFGYSREDAIGRTTYELGIVTQETQSAIIHLLETGGDLHHLEHTVICKSGEIKECLGAIEILDLPDEQYLLASLVDISERKRLEEDLRAAKQAADAASAAKSEYLALINHELRTPLNAIIGLTQLMQNDPHSAPAHAEDLATVVESGNHMLALINEVLDLAKIESGKVELVEKGFDLHNFYRSVIRALIGCGTGGEGF